MCDDLKQHERARACDDGRPMSEGRRRAILNGLFGAGWLGLRALATGVPAAILANPRRALAADPADPYAAT